MVEVPAGQLDVAGGGPRRGGHLGQRRGDLADGDGDRDDHGADAAWAGLVASLGAVDGTGIGVAIVDSGISPHSALAGKVVVSVDFTRDRNRGRGLDGYGHGTHMAGIVAGAELDQKRKAGAAGMAPGAHLINLRVLDDTGAGQVADVVEAIDWCIDQPGASTTSASSTCRSGTPVTQSYRDDPMGQAVERAVKAGIVVVASAGNRGETPEGKTVLASVSSPGNSPYAITVGAMRTNGTADRGDDTPGALELARPDRDSTTW